MLRLALYVVIIVALAIGAVWLADNPGEVSINWRGYVIELSVIWLALIVFMLMVATAAVSRLWRWIRKGYREQRKMARYEKGLDELGWGLGALMANDGARARRHADSFARLVGDVPLSHILQGQSALLLEDHEGAKQHFQALETDKRTKPLALRGLLEIAEDTGDTEAIYALSEQAQTSAPKAGWSQRPFVEAAIALGRWDGAAKALRAAIAQGHLDADEGRRMQAMVSLCRARDADSPDIARRHVNEALKFDPGLVPAAVLAAKLAHEKKRYRRAQRILKHAWVQGPHPDLVEAFVSLRAKESAAQRYKRVNQMVGSDDPQPETLYAQAVYALRAGLTGPARGHLRAMAELLPQQRTYQLLADVELAAGDAQAAQTAKDRMATAMPDPVWHCTSCGQEHFSWQITCADCSEFASVVWAPLKRKAPLVALPPELADQSADEEADDDEVMLLTDEAEEPKPPEKP